MELNATCASSLRNAGTTLPVMPARISREAPAVGFQNVLRHVKEWL